MRVGIDIDGVLYPWSEAANEALVEWYGIEDPGPHTSWDYVRQVIEPAHWEWLWSSEGQDAVFGRELVYADAVEAFNAILRDPDHRVHFVTHRDPRRCSGHTAAFLARHFGRHPWAGLHVLQNGVKKHTLADWDVFVDDKPSTVYELLLWTDAMVFAPARPWNGELAEVESERFVYYDDPREVARWVLAR